MSAVLADANLVKTKSRTAVPINPQACAERVNRGVPRTDFPQTPYPQVSAIESIGEAPENLRKPIP